MINCIKIELQHFLYYVDGKIRNIKLLIIQRRCNYFVSKTYSDLLIRLTPKEEIMRVGVLQAGGGRGGIASGAYSRRALRRLDRRPTRRRCSSLYHNVYWRHLKWRQREFSLRLPDLNAGGKH